jgi:hypothetical protein
MRHLLDVALLPVNGLSAHVRTQVDLTGAKLSGTVLKLVDLRGAKLAGARFDATDFSGALLNSATFDGYAAPPKKAARQLGAQLGRAVAGAVGRGLLAELRGGDSDEGTDDDDADGAANAEPYGGDATWLSPDEMMHVLDRAATAAASGLGQLLRARVVLSQQFNELVQRAGAL